MLTPSTSHYSGKVGRAASGRGAPPRQAVGGRGRLCPSAAHGSLKNSTLLLKIHCAASSLNSLPGSLDKPFSSPPLATWPTTAICCVPTPVSWWFESRGLTVKTDAADGQPHLHPHHKPATTAAVSWPIPASAIAYKPRAWSQQPQQQHGWQRSPLWHRSGPALRPGQPARVPGSGCHSSTRQPGQHGGGIRGHWLDRLSPGAAAAGGRLHCAGAYSRPGGRPRQAATCWARVFPAAAVGRGHSRRGGCGQPCRWGGRVLLPTRWWCTQGRPLVGSAYKQEVNPQHTHTPCHCCLRRAHRHAVDARGQG